MANVKPGPKGPVDMSPLPISHFSEDRAKRICQFAKEYIVIPKGHGARKPFDYLPFQRELIEGLYAPGVRQGLVVLARGNGKSTKAATLGVEDLFCTESAQVIVIASDQRQASIILNIVKRMIELSPELSKRARVLKDHIEVPGMGSEMYALPSDPGALQGWDPSLCIVDELHFVTRETWEAITGFAGKRPDSLTLAISTPSDQHDSVMKDLAELGRAGTDPSFYFREWTSDPEHAIDCEHCWEAANPALDAFLSRDGLRSLLHTMREPSFRRYRLAQWVSPRTAWLTPDQWADRADPLRTVSAREPITLFFDGSFSDDSTALLGCTVNDPHVFVLGLWEKPEGTNDTWRIDRAEVDKCVGDAFRSYNVTELACDPYGWRDAIQRWARRYGRTRVIEWPTHVRSRMAPATDRLSEAILEGTVTHDANDRLAAHVANCHVQHTKQGDLVTKDRQKSPRKIDAAICAIGAYDRATFHKHTSKPRKGLRVINAS